MRGSQFRAQTQELAWGSGSSQGGNAKGGTGARSLGRHLKAPSSGDRPPQTDVLDKAAPGDRPTGARPRGAPPLDRPHRSWASRSSAPYIGSAHTSVPPKLDPRGSSAPTRLRPAARPRPRIGPADVRPEAAPLPKWAPPGVSAPPPRGPEEAPPPAAPHSPVDCPRAAAALPPGSRVPGRREERMARPRRPPLGLLRALLPPLLLLLLLLPPPAARAQEEAPSPDWRATLRTIRNGVHKIDAYLNAALDLLGGDDGLCRFQCADGSKPVPRYGYKPSPPNGCGSPLFGVHLNIGIPSLTKCCNQHDRCYETCGQAKSDCDEELQDCLARICRGVQKTLGLAQHVQACESTVELLFASVLQLGCKPYLDSQRAACWCRHEQRTDL
ncbi:group XIIA secretory phospholipase A2 [Suncus etruscus]|uniref:group XIIA secretory phospholipase A2 n=1 Tax=Suncus etruscus TaxID=109475 RepID=UPI00210F28E0|nr:group XIIA secretory phospholipase A2 [Suncus etruscus]